MKQPGIVGTALYGISCPINVYFLFLFRSGVSKYSNPLSLISYIVANNKPIVPLGNPFWWNHTRYASGRSQMSVSLYFPKGISVATNRCRVSSGFIANQSLVLPYFM